MSLARDPIGTALAGAWTREDGRPHGPWCVEVRARRAHGPEGFGPWGPWGRNAHGEEEEMREAISRWRWNRPLFARLGTDVEARLVRYVPPAYAGAAEPSTPPPAPKVAAPIPPDVAHVVRVVDVLLVASVRAVIGAARIPEERVRAALVDGVARGLLVSVSGRYDLTAAGEDLADRLSRAR